MLASGRTLVSSFLLWSHLLPIRGSFCFEVIPWRRLALGLAGVLGRRCFGFGIGGLALGCLRLRFALGFLGPFAVGLVRRNSSALDHGLSLRLLVQVLVVSLGLVLGLSFRRAASRLGVVVGAGARRLGSSSGDDGELRTTWR